MGCDIETFVEIRKENEWVHQKDVYPFMRRNYNVFAFLANVRNDDDIIPLDSPRDIPEKLDPFILQQYHENFGDDIIFTSSHSASYVTLDELLNFDYNKIALITEDPFNPESKIKRYSYSEYLGENYFLDIDKLIELYKGIRLNDKGIRLNDIRITFWFYS